MAENELDRRTFLKTTGAIAGAAGLAGCNSLGRSNSDDSETDTSTDTDEPTTASNPTYDIRTSALEYDLTDLPTEEAIDHNKDYVQENYSAQPGVTVLENGEEVGLEELSDVHLEDGEGEEVERTEEGYVPEYAVSDGEELTVRAEVDGETLEDTITVTKELPGEFYADAKIQEDGEVLYNTDWNTPYNFDTQIVDRQAFLDQRAERRDELADDEIILESDLETWRGYFEEEEDELTEEEKKEYFLGAMSGLMQGASIYEGTGSDNNAFNLEKAMLENSPYEEVFIGGFRNPAEPDVPRSTDGRGNWVDSHVAYVDGDWFHVGKEYGGAYHITDINEIAMVQDFINSPSSQWAVSVLGEMEEGGAPNNEPFVKKAVTSPVYAGDKGSTLEDTFAGELELGDDIAWETLSQIRNNEEWVETMVPLELAAGVTNETPITDVITASKDQGGFQIEVEKGE